MTETKRVRTRFAPSPTGPLHLGGVRTALYCYLFAKKHGGDFLLRIEDTDQTRYVPGAEEYIIESLRWAGIEPSEGPHLGGPHAPYRQSERKHLYKQYADQLIAAGHAYYAFDTTEDLDNFRKRSEEAGNKSAKYDAITREYMKNSQTLPQEETAARLHRGDAHVIRFKMPRNEEVRFHDEIRGWVTVNTRELDDKVLMKADGMPTYHLANVVDDHLMEISHVFRGEEWLPSAPLHVLLHKALGWEADMPKFAHLPLILKPDGNGKLSKRDGDRLGFPVFSLNWTDPFTGELSSGYREAGYLPAAYVNILALLGWHPSDNQELFTLDQLVEAFTLERVTKSGAKFDPEKARWFNAHYLRLEHKESLAEVLKDQIEAAGLPAQNTEYLEAIVELVKEKATLLPDLLPLSRFFFEAPTDLNADVLKKRWNPQAPAFFSGLAMRFNELNDWSATGIQQAYENYCTLENAKPGQWMQVLRVLTTGAAGGPSLWHILALLGKDAVIERMAVEVSVP